MSKKELDLRIDFADASYRSCEMIYEKYQYNLIVYLDSWEEKTIKIIFSNTIRYVYSEGDVISAAYEKDEKDAFFSEALKRHYDQVPMEYQFKTYLIVDIYDSPIFQVIAENVEVTLY